MKHILPKARSTWPIFGKLKRAQYTEPKTAIVPKTPFIHAQYLLSNLYIEMKTVGVERKSLGVNNHALLCFGGS